MWRVWVRRGGCIGSWWGNRREGDHWGDLGVDGWIILGWISRRWDVGLWVYAQHLNHCATAVPHLSYIILNFINFTNHSVWTSCRLYIIHYPREKHTLCSSQVQEITLPLNCARFEGLTFVLIRFPILQNIAMWCRIPEDGNIVF